MFIVLDRDGMDLLDLGCGWGSVALFLAARYIFESLWWFLQGICFDTSLSSRFPGSRVKALSNSNQQREYIEEQAKERGITNLNVITGDVAKVMVMTYVNGDEVHQDGKGQREWQVYLISIFLNRAKIFAHFRIKTTWTEAIQSWNYSNWFTTPFTL